MQTYDILTDEQLATVVAGVDAHRAVRERLGMCGCGLCRVQTS